MEKTFHIDGKGDIHYWILTPQEFKKTLVFLPGLTADHRLFEAQIEYFSKEYQTIVWDAPAHGKSRPWNLDFSLMDMTDYLHRILQYERVEHPVIIGQSLGGYLAQCYMEKYKNELSGFVSIDSAPLQRAYMSAIEIYLLKHTKAMFHCFSWNGLVNAGSNGCAVTDEGRKLMKTMMLEYTKKDFIKLCSYGFKILAEAIELNLPYRLTCHTLLICGSKDMAGYTKSYNKKWSKKANLRLLWIENAGHNSNTDRPNEVNSAIEDFLNNTATMNT